MRRCWLLVSSPRRRRSKQAIGPANICVRPVPFGCCALAAILDEAEIARLLVDTGELLAPLVEQLHIDGASVAVTALLQFADQVSAGKSTGAGDHHRIAS